MKSSKPLEEVMRLKQRGKITRFTRLNVRMASDVTAFDSH